MLVSQTLQESVDLLRGMKTNLSNRTNSDHSLHKQTNNTPIFPEVRSEINDSDFKRQAIAKTTVRVKHRRRWYLVPVETTHYDLSDQGDPFILAQALKGLMQAAYEIIILKHDFIDAKFLDPNQEPEFDRCEKRYCHFEQELEE